MEDREYVPVGSEPISLEFLIDRRFNSEVTIDNVARIDKERDGKLNDQT